MRDNRPSPNVLTLVRFETLISQEIYLVLRCCKKSLSVLNVLALVDSKRVIGMEPWVLMGTLFNRRRLEFRKWLTLGPALTWWNLWPSKCTTKQSGLLTRCNNDSAQKSLFTTILSRIWCAFFVQENYDEIMPGHCTCKVHEKWLKD